MGMVDRSWIEPRKLNAGQTIEYGPRIRVLQGGKHTINALPPDVPPPPHLTANSSGDGQPAPAASSRSPAGGRPVGSPEAAGGAAG